MTQPALSSELPVLVFGALRSGTTVFRLMLNAHGDLANPGEVDFLFDFLKPDPAHQSGWRYDRDGLRDNRIFKASGLSIPDGKDGLDLLNDFLEQYQGRDNRRLTLNIHRNIGRALQVLPGANVIHMLRDPRDVARSSIGMGWAGTLYHGVDHWIRTETDWDGVAVSLPREQILELRYETLFAEIEVELRRVCDFLGVVFDNGMLAYHRDTTYGPPDKSLIEQWKRKSTTRELALVQGKAAAMMRARGYEPTEAVAFPGPLARFWLRLCDRVFVWRFSIRRFGAGLFLMEKLTRHLGAERLHRHFSTRMREKSKSFLK